MDVKIGLLKSERGDRYEDNIQQNTNLRGSCSPDVCGVGKKRYERDRRNTY
jgi:hypothetical protein